MRIRVVPGVERCISIVLLALAVACGSSDGGGEASAGSGGTAGGGGRSGASGGSSGSPSAGVGGRAGAPGTGGAAASGGSVTGGAAGSAGGAPVVPGDVFNPNLPPPSYDCRTDTQTKQCISIRGTLNGQSIDRHCALATSPTVLFRNPDVWPAACVESGSSNAGYWYQLTIPIQTPGSFSHNVAPGTPYGADVAVALDGRGGDVRARHFVNAVVAGSVQRDATTTNDILVGTIRATWGMPGADCTARLAQTCAPAELHGTFKVEHYLKREDF